MQNPCVHSSAMKITRDFSLLQPFYQNYHNSHAFINNSVMYRFTKRFIPLTMPIKASGRIVKFQIRYFER